jgi:hypothetical protein
MINGAFSFLIFILFCDSSYFISFFSSLFLSDSHSVDSTFFARGSEYLIAVFPPLNTATSIVTITLPSEMTTNNAANSTSNNNATTTTTTTSSNASPTTSHSTTPAGANTTADSNSYNLLQGLSFKYLYFYNLVDRKGKGGDAESECASNSGSKLRSGNNSNAASFSSSSVVASKESKEEGANKRKGSDASNATTLSISGSGNNSRTTGSAKKRKVGADDKSATAIGNSTTNNTNTPSKSKKKESQLKMGVVEEEAEAMQVEIPSESNPKQKRCPSTGKESDLLLALREKESNSSRLQSSLSVSRGAVVLRESRLRLCHGTLSLLIDFFTQMVRFRSFCLFVCLFLLFVFRLISISLSSFCKLLLFLSDLFLILQGAANSPSAPHRGWNRERFGQVFAAKITGLIYVLLDGLMLFLASSHGYCPDLIHGTFFIFTCGFVFRFWSFLLFCVFSRVDLVCKIIVSGTNLLFACYLNISIGATIMCAKEEIHSVLTKLATKSGVICIPVLAIPFFYFFYFFIYYLLFMWFFLLILILSSLFPSSSRSACQGGRGLRPSRLTLVESDEGLGAGQVERNLTADEVTDDEELMRRVDFVYYYWFDSILFDRERK